MKANQKYILNTDLDLKNENFLVKKGTQLEILKLHDENDKYSTTKAVVKFQKINGNYFIEEREFCDRLLDNTLALKAEQKYSVGSCVKHTVNGNGIILRYWHDPDFNLDLYTVEFNEKVEVVLEKNLQAVPC